MMKRVALANIFGCLSVACSAMIWMLLGLRMTIRHFFQGIDLSISGWMLVWGFGLLLALIAARLGSRRWL
ncbi:MAG: hypothetical protein P4L51_20405, partial [Puia sp.]|nr:hypothetical protein [Puia sp.]